MARKKNTRSPNGSGMVRLRSDGRWEGRYSDGYNAKTGKPVPKSIYGKTQAEVTAKLQAIGVAKNTGLYVAPSKMTVGEWLDIWVKAYLVNLKPKTATLYEGYVRNRIKPGLGQRKLSDLTSHDIQLFCNRLQQPTATLSALTPKSIKNVHGVLHKALNQALEDRFIQFNPATNTKLPRIEKKEMQVLSDDSLVAFLEAIIGHQFEYLYWIDLFTGLRQSEILGLTWDCVTYKKGTIYIYRQLQRIDQKYQFAPPKNDKPRRITMGNEVMEVFKRQMIRQSEWQLKAGQAWNNPDQLIFTNELGQHLTHQTVYKHYKKIVRNMGLPDLRFHDMRHSYAVASLQSGDSVKTLQENMGHYSAAFTLDRYGHVSDAMQQKSADLMDEFIRNIRAE